MQATVHDLVQSAKVSLASITDTPALEAEVLLADVLGCPRTRLLAWPMQALEPAVISQFNACIQRRMLGEPLAYITGKKEFWSREFTVSEATLIPRPDTETLIETVLTLFPEPNGQLRLVDLGTGSGIIAITLQLERPQWEVHAVDISEDAYHIASNNAHAFGCERIVLHCGNWCNALPPASFEVVVSNPPYLSEAEWPVYAAGLQYEPKAALVAGPDGLTALREVILGAKRVLKPGGVLLLEHGFNQAEGVQSLLREAGYVAVSTINDASLRPRVTQARLTH